MKARYTGQCAWCGNRISIGEDIHKVADCWIHQDCRVIPQPNSSDIGDCCTCHETRLLVGEFDGRYCRECWHDLAECIQDDYGHIHDIYDMPF